MGADQLPVHYHDVVGIAVIIGDEGFQPQEVFRYPFFNEDPPHHPLGPFDRIPPGILTTLLKTNTINAPVGELLEMVFDDIRLISRPVKLKPERGGKERTADFFNLVFAVSSEYCPRPQLYPASRLPKHPRKKTASAVTAPGVVCGAQAGTAIASAAGAPPAAAHPSGPAGGDDIETPGGFPPAEEDLDGELGEMEVEEVGFVSEAEARGDLDKDGGVDLALLRGALMMVSRSMCLEEGKNGYISRAGRNLQLKKECRTSDRDKFMADMYNVPLDNGSGVYVNFGGRLIGGARQYPQGDMKARGDERWQESVMQESQLARDMRTLYEHLTSGEPFEMTIKRASVLSINVIARPEVPAVRRFETLLLREEKDIALDGHPSDGSPQIRRLIEIVDPHQTLEELAYANEIELSQMLRLARHMVYWGDGRVVDALCGSNRYQVTREALKAAVPGSSLRAEFGGRFPKRDLIHELSRFGTMQPLSEILGQSKKTSHKALIAVLTHLLRRDLLVQVHRYVSLAIPRPSPDAESETDSSDDEDSGCDEEEEEEEEDDRSAVGNDRVKMPPRGGSRLRSIFHGGSSDMDSVTDASRRAGDGDSDRGGVGISPRLSDSADSVGATRADGAAGGAPGVGAITSSGAAGAGAVGGDSNPDDDSVGGSRLRPHRPSEEEEAEGCGNSGDASPAAASAGPATTAAAAAAANNRDGVEMGTTTGAGSGGATFRGTFSGSIVGYPVDAAGNAWFDAPVLEDYEEEYLRNRDDGSEASDLFRRLAPLFRGKLSLREVIWRLEIANLPLLESVLDKYSDVLHEVWRPARDPDPSEGAVRPR